MCCGKLKPYALLNNKFWDSCRNSHEP